jgi:hypothetical protein
MFNKIISDKRKAIAWFLFFVFYLQLVTPVLANRLSDPYRLPLPSVQTGKRLLLNPTIGEHVAATNSSDRRVQGSQQSDQSEVRKLHPALQDGPGPTQPEMQSFQSVNTNNMVDLFTGDFSYNIPLLDVGGYPVSMHYNSGITMDQEASWVGLGWNINAGTINRTMRGLPDDFNGSDRITKTVAMKANKTIGVTAGANAELFGKSKNVPPKGNATDTTKGRPTSIGFSLGVFHNTYNGWGTETGINAGINAGSAAKGHLSGGFGLTNNSQSGLDVAPSFSYQLGRQESNSKGLNIGIGTNFNSRIGIQALQMTMQLRQQTNAAKSLNTILSGAVPDAAQISFATPSFTPGISLPFTSQQFTFTVKVGSEKWAYHPNFFVSGNFASQYIDIKDQTQSFPAYGYLYYQEAENQDSVLLDFNREKEVAFRGTTPNIAIPGYTYDIYSITGEGTGGMFRPYRGDVGMIYDHSMSTKSGSGKITLDLGFGSVFHGGIDLNKVYANTKTNAWSKDNVMARYIGFRKTDSLYENVYFKNPGEKVTVDQSFYDKIGDDKLVRVQLSPEVKQNAPVVTATRNLTIFSNAKPVGTIALDANTYKTQRDKRTQVISYLTAKEATVVGLDKKIKSFNINSFPSNSCNTNYTLIDRVGDIRKEHHLSEISVLNSDGRKYVYGIPAYNIEQNDVSFSVDKVNGDNTAGLVSYDSTKGIADNFLTNNKGKDNYYSKEKIPPYAHSFLLSGIESPDYVDITGDGITEDDNGNAIKINYSQVYGNANPYRWRAPFDLLKASYNEGLKTYSRDDKGNYSYGTKEVWYMNSIESKTMMATFVLETDSIRQDSYGTINENGGLNSSQKLYRLKQINLYTKADFLKNGVVNAKPIKSVHFEYSYELCNGVPSSNGTGKLTLKKVWFSYNKNYKGKLNPYIFSYNNNNPSFNNKSYDRWGNYKNPDDNPGTTGNKLTNGEYPYTLQTSVNGWDSSKASGSVAAWTLSDIKLPSGGLMKVSYESDDYAYVQNRRAMQMFSIAGLGSSAGAVLSDAMYPQKTSGADYFYVFVRLNTAVTSKSEIKERYFEGITKLYFKLFVKMPDGKDYRWGNGYEQVPCFADIVDYDIKAGFNNKMIWVKVAALKNGNSPMANSAIQFLRLNLPGKAYPYSEPGDEASFKDVIGMIMSSGANFKNAVIGFDNASRTRNWCNNIDTTKSFVRLNNPEYKKLGGGLRVKKVQIYDNWTTMTSQTESSYGQTYEYSTTKLVNGINTRISSGVSSYEPALGKEENPFFLPIEYAEKMALAGPTDFVYTEEPLGESFFPSPVVGYSKVTVQTINNTKKSANGTDVTEFYTASEFPTIFENTPLDNESKKTFANPLGNLLKFDAKRYITLSQGFKVELNDMHGKMKSQSTYAQTDLEHPISYTSNYYKLDNDNAYAKHLSNKVTSADSATGVINNNSQMGKEIDILIDIREQVSKTISGSLQLNVDIAKIIPFVIFPSKPNLPSFETNQFRSIAVTKIVNRYAILDSVVHFDKGSKISTANMVYDGETGNVLLSRTQNEFNDPVYSFNYPAYWAYSGMEGAYKNIGGNFKSVGFLNGKMSYQGMSETDIKKYFESGDEILFYGKIKRGRGSEICKAEDFNIDTAMKIWAIDLSKAYGGSPGIFFVDKDGIPVSGFATGIKIIRSGKRNLQGTSAGAITSLQSPVKLVNGVNRFVFDSTTAVIAASAAKFKDFWKVDSNSYRKDTVFVIPKLADSVCYAIIKPTETYAVRNKKPNNKGRTYYGEPDHAYFEAFANSNGCNNHSDESLKTWMLFDFASLPANSIIKSATLTLQAPDSQFPQFYNRASSGGFSNASVISRPTSVWIKDYINMLPNIGFFQSSYRQSVLKQFSQNTGPGVISTNGQVNVSATPYNVKQYNTGNFTVTAMVQDMLNNYTNSGGKNKPSIVIDMPNAGACDNTGVSGMDFAFRPGSCYNSTSSYTKSSLSKSMPVSDCIPYLTVCYTKPCFNGGMATFSNTPTPGYYCYSQPVDSFICKPNINDTATNPYRWGILGNWQVDRAYSYFNSRKDSSVSVSSVTNIRKDGVINNFQSYWSFTTGKMQDSQDSSRWVWNSEINLINSKGLELQNHDPLNRYNSAQYGYNQTLPVAVAQNSRNREMVFDGFEDYGYSTDNCSSCAKNRFINLIAGGTLVDTVSHTGIYSLRVEGNQTDSVTVPVVSYTTDSLAARVIGKISSTLISDTIVRGTGQGLNTTHAASGTCGASEITNIDVNYGYGGPAGCRADHFSTIWTGYIQPRYSELYTFYADADDMMKVYVNNIRISENAPVESRPTFGNYSKLKSVFLYAGQLYPISAIMTENSGLAYAHLKWQSASQLQEIVPKSQLYTVNSAPGSISVSTRLCVKLDTLKQSNITLNGFSPLQGTKIVIGAWVKEKNNNPDTVSAYRNTQIQLVFNNGSTYTVKPSGNIIDGWQRIEDTLTIPLNATQVKVRLMSTNSTIPVYFDDVRIHPFNSNVKSFVYNPVNIRLMAELDENNYASFYEYDDDGTLIRVKKETEKGIKTIKETRSALLK